MIIEERKIEMYLGAERMGDARALFCHTFRLLSACLKVPLVQGRVRQCYSGIEASERTPAGTSEAFWSAVQWYAREKLAKRDFAVTSALSDLKKNID